MVPNISPTETEEIERLPSELYQHIISHLPRSDLPKAMAVSSSFYLPASRSLYATLDVDLSTGINPFARAEIPKGATGPPSPDSNSLSASHPNLLASLPSPFNNTKHLTLNVHSLSDCGKLAPLIMPNLESLHIRHNNSLDVRMRCHCRRLRSLTPCRKPKSCHCPLIASLQPTTLILNNTQSGLAGSAFPWPSPTTSVPAFIEHLVVGVFALAQLVYSREFLAAVPQTVKRLTLVVQLWKNREGGDEGWVTESEDGMYSDQANSFLNKMWSEMMGWALVGKAELVEVVGYDHIGNWSEKELEEQVEDVRKFLQMAFTSKGICGVAEAEERVHGVRFMTAEQYIDEADGEGMRAVREMVREVAVVGRYRRQN